MYLAGWRKEHSIYIPITVLNPHGSRELLKLEVEYSTLLQERIKFVSDMITRSESYTLKENGHEQVIYERDLINEYYILPGNKGSSN
ncbi:hypothetical protein J7I80_11550 [Bacillus sp. ISL-41]|uniref:hypothetical protein n=1 Tax=Bacillus sp. ISL-41 TaxID=2819127 RepID=UPI001BE51E1B|nr:hypothetical protein [Bacillus sp. ISL-41]MBT2642863.1 hypothetical protein [Bacillus sp. ISL-41]